MKPISCFRATISVSWRRVSRKASQTAKVAVVVEQVPFRVCALWVWEKRLRTIGRGRATVHVILVRTEGAGRTTCVIRVNSLTALCLRCETKAISAKGKAGCHDETIFLKRRRQKDKIKGQRQKKEKRRRFKKTPKTMREDLNTKNFFALYCVDPRVPLTLLKWSLIRQWDHFSK